MDVKQVKLSKNIDENIQLALEKLPSVRLCKRRCQKLDKKIKKLEGIAEMYGYK